MTARSGFWAMLRLVFVCAPLLLSGCMVPPLDVAPKLPTAPRLSDLKQHMVCLLADAIDQHLGPKADRTTPDYVLWYHLVQYNVLDTISFTLFVNQNQGLNPNLNFITPLTNLGGPIKSVIESSDGTDTVSNATANTFNFTLSVGFQLSGMQDHNFVLNYVVDLHRVYQAMLDENKGGTDYLRDKGTIVGLRKTCDDIKKRIATGGMPYGLKGDLAVENTIEAGLESLDATDFSPVTAGKTAQPAMASVSQAAGATAFSSKIDFSLTWGVNGGPSWNLLRFKGPGGGSGNGQLLSYSRQKQDTLISSFAATCKADELIDLRDPVSYIPPPPPPIVTVGKNDTFTLTAQERAASPAPPPPPGQKPAPAYPRQFIINGGIPQDPNGQSYFAVSNAIGTISINTLVPPNTDFPNMDGTISWGGFVTVTPNNTSYLLRGLMSEAQAGTPVGYVYLGIVKYKDGHTKLTDFRISRNGIDSIYGETRPGPIDYWTSLPSCGFSGPFLANGLNLLQQLPADVSSTLQQQR